MNKDRRMLFVVVFFVILIVGGIVAFNISGMGRERQEAAEETQEMAEDRQDADEDSRETGTDRQDITEEEEGTDRPDADAREAKGDPHDRKNMLSVSDDGEDEEEEEEELPDILILVNQTHDVPEDWSVDLVEIENGQFIDSRAYEGLKAMIDDARELGLDPLICSSYRTYEKQTSLYEDKVKYFTDRGYPEEEARELAAEYVAAPDTSEHQLGLAVDICAESYQELEVDQENTEVQQWLMANCYRYGFILRYPKDKTEITGVTYEPWHYRYVGVEAATEIYEQGLCLEEYLEQ